MRESACPDGVVNPSPFIKVVLRTELRQLSYLLFFLNGYTQTNQQSFCVSKYLHMFPLGSAVGCQSKKRITAAQCVTCKSV